MNPNLDARPSQPRIVAKGLDTVVLAAEQMPLQCVLEQVIAALARWPRQNAPILIPIDGQSFALTRDKLIANRFVLSTGGIDLMITKSRYRGPFPVKMQISSKLLWTTEPQHWLALAQRCAKAVTGEDYSILHVDRLDMCMDVVGASVPPRESFPANVRVAQYGTGSQVSGCVTGGRQSTDTSERPTNGHSTKRVTIYNKSSRIALGSRQWMEQVWRSNGYTEAEGPVIRIECQLRHPRLKKLGIDTVADLHKAPAAWSVSFHRFRLRLPVPGQPRKKWPELPWWTVVREGFGFHRPEPSLPKALNAADRQRREHQALAAAFGLVARAAAFAGEAFNTYLRDLPRKAAATGKDYEQITRAIAIKHNQPPT